jgi:protein-S-isoprenylcysteine O-methyltransferase Ste14
VEVTTILAVAGLLVWVGYEFALRRREPDTASWEGGQSDEGTTRLLLGAYVLSVGVNVVAGIIGIAMVPEAWRWVGIAVLVTGLVLRAWAMLVLRASYTRTVRAVDGQQLVRRGPYAVIRHPGYAGSLLVWVGYSLGLGSGTATVVVAAILIVAYGRRISVEEQVLAAAFGSAWDDYVAGTGRLIPFMW